MTIQTYDVLFPFEVTTGNTLPQGGTVQLDDADPNTQGFLADGVIVLASSPGAGADVTTAETDTTTQDKGPGWATTPPGQMD